MNIQFTILCIMLKGLFDQTIIFSSLSNSSFIQYCDSNFGLFSIASHIVFALLTIATVIVVALTRSYRRQRRVKVKLLLFLALSKAIAICVLLLFAIAFKNVKERQLYYHYYYIIGKAITVWEAIEKSLTYPISPFYAVK